MSFYFVPFFSETKNLHFPKLGTLCSQFRPHHLFSIGGLAKLEHNFRDVQGSELEHKMDQNCRFGQK
jgi:hypothetical protein